MLSNSLSVPSYYLVLSVVICIALIWSVRRADQMEISRKLVLDLSLVLMIAGFLGGRLFHVFYEEWDYYQSQPERIFAFWSGGFVFYGGALLAGASGFIFLRWKSIQNVRPYLDLMTPLASFCYAFGRLACLLAGCCYGRVCDLPWAIAGRHPTQLYAFFWELGSLFILLGLEKRPLRPGNLFFSWLILHGTGRLLMEFYRDDFRGAEWGLSISGWISCVLILVGALVLFFGGKSEPKKAERSY